jgi:hypothetical protein
VVSGIVPASPENKFRNKNLEARTEEIQAEF